MSLVFLLIFALFSHERALEIQMVLLILPFSDFIAQVPITLLMDLVNDLPEQIFLLNFKDNALIESVTHISIDKACHERIWHTAFRFRLREMDY